jgi:hypothetical protein
VRNAHWLAGVVRVELSPAILRVRDGRAARVGVGIYSTPAVFVAYDCLSAASRRILTASASRAGRSCS